MRKCIAVLFASCLLVPLWVSPGVATDARSAIRSCEQNPKCSYNVRNDGDVDIRVDGQYIVCPQGSNSCECITCRKQADGKKQVRSPSVANILRSN